MTEFSGVRSSCETMERKSDLARSVARSNVTSRSVSTTPSDSTTSGQPMRWTTAW